MKPLLRDNLRKLSSQTACYYTFFCASLYVLICHTKERAIHTSKRSAQWRCSRIRSPLASVSSRLSSMTEFIFSTQSASTSPSKTKYFRSFLSVGLLMSRKMFDRSPSVQSLVFGSRTPYSSTTLRSFGLIVYSFVVRPNLQRQSPPTRQSLAIKYEKQEAQLSHVACFMSSNISLSHSRSAKVIRNKTVEYSM